jgi:hypothetical protein
MGKAAKWVRLGVPGGGTPRNILALAASPARRGTRRGASRSPGCREIVWSEPDAAWRAVGSWKSGRPARPVPAVTSPSTSGRVAGEGAQRWLCSGGASSGLAGCGEPAARTPATWRSSPAAGAGSRRTSSRARRSPRPRSCWWPRTGSGPGGGSRGRRPPATSAAGWASRSTTPTWSATRGGCGSGPPGVRRPDRRTDRVHPPGRRLGAAAAGVNRRCTGWTGPAGDRVDRACRRRMRPPCPRSAASARGQPLTAMSSSTASRVRTRTPVPPFGV